MLVFLLLAAGILPVFASPIDEKQNELSDVKGEISQSKTVLKEQKKQESEILRDIRLLETDINKIQVEIRSLASKISQTEENIQITEDELAEAEERIAIMDALLSTRLRVIYESGQVNYLDVLFNSASFTEFLTRYNDLQLILEQDRELLTEFQTERERIVGIKEELEERRQELIDLRRTNLAKKQEVEIKSREREQLLAAVREEIDEREEAIKKLETEAKKIEEIIKQLQAQQRGVGFRGNGQYVWPVPDFGPSWITSGYGIRVDPITRRPGAFHGGIDIGISHNRWPGSRSYSGVPVNVVAVDSGIAHTYRMGSGYGNLVIIDHGGGMATVYGHNHSFLVANGQSVQRGQAISIVGSTGYSTGPHLHFEVRVNGERVNPLPYVR
jgi:murein DD-endopeptidase MepM/ murein hydrolase activator NlpD